MKTTTLKKIALATAGTTAIGMTMLAGVMSPAEAALTLFTDQTAFNATTQGLTTIDFEGLAPTNWSSSFPNPAGLTQSGVNFTSSPNYLNVVDPGFYPAYYDWGSGAVLLGLRLGTINAALPSGVTAVGSDIFSILDYASNFVINLSTGDSFTVSSSNYPNRSFVGFTSDVDITSISFTATSGYPELDNFTFGTRKPIAIPEPSSVLGLLALGGLGIGSVLRRKIK